MEAQAARIDCDPGTAKHLHERRLIAHQEQESIGVGGRNRDAGRPVRWAGDPDLDLAE